VQSRAGQSLSRWLLLCALLAGVFAMHGLTAGHHAGAATGSHHHAMHLGVSDDGPSYAAQLSGTAAAACIAILPVLLLIRRLTGGILRGRLDPRRPSTGTTVRARVERPPPRHLTPTHLTLNILRI